MAGSYGITPAIRKTDGGVLYLGYQQSGIGVFFERKGSLKLTLNTLRHASDIDPTPTEIPIIDQVDAANHLEKLQIIDQEIMQPLRIFLAQMDGDIKGLVELKIPYSERAVDIDRMISLMKGPQTDATRNSLFEAVSSIASNTGDTISRRRSATSKNVEPPSINGNITDFSIGKDLHSGLLGPLSLPPQVEVFRTMEINPEKYNDVIPDKAPVLLITKGSRLTKFDLSTLSLGESYIVGRHPECDVILDEAAVSRKHCRIDRVTEGFEIVDMRSRNQTLVNGKALTPDKPRKLAVGDQIKICNYVIYFNTNQG